jgi:hypothetical protein
MQPLNQSTQTALILSAGPDIRFYSVLMMTAAMVLPLSRNRHNAEKYDGVCK